MLDGLGVRDMTIEECRDFLKKRDELVADFESQKDKLQSEFQRLVDMLGQAPNQKGPGVKVKIPIPEVATFGDTIVLTWDIQHYRDVAVMLFSHDWVSKALVWCMEEGLRLRGAIAIGEYV